MLRNVPQCSATQLIAVLLTTKPIRRLISSGCGLLRTLRINPQTNFRFQMLLVFIRSFLMKTIRKENTLPVVSIHSRFHLFFGLLRYERSNQQTEKDQVKQITCFLLSWSRSRRMDLQQIDFIVPPLATLPPLLLK